MKKPTKIDGKICAVVNIISLYLFHARRALLPPSVVYPVRENALFPMATLLQKAFQVILSFNSWTRDVQRESHAIFYTTAASSSFCAFGTDVSENIQTLWIRLAYMAKRQSPRASRKMPRSSEGIFFASGRFGRFANCFGPYRYTALVQNDFYGIFSLSATQQNDKKSKQYPMAFPNAVC